MDTLFFCTRWGQASIPWDAFARKVKAAGYDGIETDLPATDKERNEVLNAIAANNLFLIAQHWETVTENFEQHLEEYKERIERLAAAEPLFINSQTGKDYYSFAQNEALLQVAETIAQQTGIPVYHETHRGKFSFAAHVTGSYLKQLPQLLLTLDISHWCAVAETLLHDQAAVVASPVAEPR